MSTAATPVNSASTRQAPRTFVRTRQLCKLMAKRNPAGARRYRESPMTLGAHNLLGESRANGYHQRQLCAMTAKRGTPHGMPRRCATLTVAPPSPAGLHPGWPPLALGRARPAPRSAKRPPWRRAGAARQARSCPVILQPHLASTKPKPNLAAGRTAQVTPVVQIQLRASSTQLRL